MSIFGIIWGSITGLFSSANEIVDNVHTSEEEKLQLRNGLATIHASVQKEFLSLEAEVIKLQHETEMAEIKSSSWFRQNWRPCCAVGITITIIILSFMNIPVPEQLSQLANVFLPTYALARTAESIVPKMKK